MRNLIQRQIWLLTILVLGVGLAWFIISLASHYRLSGDDWYCLYNSKIGFPGVSSAALTYTGRDGAFLGFFIQAVSFWGLSHGIEYWTILMFLVFGLVASFIYLINSFLKLIPKSSIVVLLISLIAIVSLIVGSPKIEEVWFWATGNCYLYPIISFSVMLGAMFRKNVPLAVMAMAFFVLSRVTYSSSVLACGVLFLFYICGQSKRMPHRIEWIYLIFYLVFLAINVAAPGNYLRMKTEVAEPCVSVFCNQEFIAHLVELTKLIVYPLRLAFFGIVVGFAFSKLDFKSTFAKSWSHFLPLALFVTFVVVHAILFKFATGKFGYPRVYSFHSFLLHLVIGYYSVLLVKLAQERIKLLNNPILVTTIVIAGSFALMGKLYTGYAERLATVSEFSKQFDLRYEQILSSGTADADTLFVNRLPSSGMLFYHEFMEAGYYTNMTFERAHDLPFQVAIKSSNSGTKEKTQNP